MGHGRQKSGSPEITTKIQRMVVKPRCFRAGEALTMTLISG